MLLIGIIRGVKVWEGLNTEKFVKTIRTSK